MAEVPDPHIARLIETHHAKTPTPATDTIMHRKVLLPWGILLRAAFAIVLLGGVALAQSSQSAPDRAAEVREVLRQGQELEVEHRWGEALSHYEEAVRQFPKDHGLQRR